MIAFLIGFLLALLEWIVGPPIQENWFWNLEVK